MRTHFWMTLNTLLVLLCFQAYAQEKCVSGQADQTNLTDQLSEAQKNSPVTKLIYSQYKLDHKTTEGQADCATCKATDSAAEQAKKIQMTLAKIPKAPQLVFNADCMKASNQFLAAVPEVVCPTMKNPAQTQIPFKRKPVLCMTDSFLKYQNAMISNFAGCAMKEGLKGVDVSSLFKLYSVETGFKPQYFSKNGRGLGQLTGIFIDDIFQNKTLQKIANSQQPECEAAKMIATQDLKTKPSKTNPCEFSAVGSGMERNILYSLIGMNTFYKRIEKHLTEYTNKHAEHPQITEVRNLALLNAYGPKGPAGARATIKRLSSLNPTEFIRALNQPLKLKNDENLTVYTQRIAKREKELQAKLPPELRKNYESQGASACINPF